jgi:hypothetical protein
MDKNTFKLIENASIQALIALPDADFNKALEMIKRLHYERLGFKYADPDNPATCETCE